jgi:ribonucleotide reductase beta subunit family protein with ferritin-like domain
VNLANCDIKGMTVFNKNNVDTLKQNMFFGSPLGIQRYDVHKFPVFYKLTQQQLGAFWRPEAYEYKLTKDRADYQKLRPEHKHIFTSNLKYQIMLDSVQGRGPGMAFIPYCSLPELESAMICWEFMEMIHSYSYTFIIKNVYSDPSEVFDSIIDDDNILERAKSVTESYDEYLQTAQNYSSSNMWKFKNEGVDIGKDELFEVKRKLYRAIANVNILEGVRFYVSFACSFAFGQNHLMEGSAKIISKIATDERLHLFLTQNILTKWKNGEDDPDMKVIASQEEAYFYKMFEKTVDEEKRWANYLFKDGSMIGLNAKLLHNYVEWIANRRMKAIGLKPIYDVPANNNPLPWTEDWLNSKNVQNPPQEEPLESYIVGGIKQDIDSDTFSGFKL